MERLPPPIVVMQISWVKTETCAAIERNGARWRWRSCWLRRLRWHRYFISELSRPWSSHEAMAGDAALIDTELVLP